MILSTTLLFLDFDGVICDSIQECFASSRIAYFNYFKNEEADTIKNETKNAFYSLRPYVRNGEDYLFLHEIIEKEIIINNQKDFNFYVEQQGPKKTLSFRELFYKARNFLLNTKHDYWLNMNPIFANLKESFNKSFAIPSVFILSTKKPDYIKEILDFHNIYINPERIINSLNKKKCSIISQILNLKEMKTAIFIDDQIDHLIQNQDRRIRTYLASWGYIQEKWLTSGIQVMTEEKLIILLNPVKGP